VDLPTVSLSRDACDERLRAALIDITTHPERWDQEVWGHTGALPDQFTTSVGAGEWPCRTACCLAGNIAIRERMVIGIPDTSTGMTQTALQITDEGQRLIVSERTGLPWDDSQNGGDFAGLGAALLGLSRISAVFLFKADHSLLDLWEMASYYTEGRVALPDELRESVHRIDEALATGRTDAA
jgi:hypothetical protein